MNDISFEPKLYTFETLHRDFCCMDLRANSYAKTIPF